VSLNRAVDVDGESVEARHLKSKLFASVNREKGPRLEEPGAEGLPSSLALEPIRNLARSFDTKRLAIAAVPKPASESRQAHDETVFPPKEALRK
jgi:hypothetical protein